MNSSFLSQNLFSILNLSSWNDTLIKLVSHYSVSDLEVILRPLPPSHMILKNILSLFYSTFKYFWSPFYNSCLYLSLKYCQFENELLYKLHEEYPFLVWQWKLYFKNKHLLTICFLTLKKNLSFLSGKSQTFNLDLKDLIKMSFFNSNVSIFCLF